VPHSDFERNVFVNCPFDEDYEQILQAILFCVIRFGLRPRIATERSDSGENRLDKIQQLIAESRYSIHDLSRCQSLSAGEMYRLNMPFELGLDVGCRTYGPRPFETKAILVLEERKYRYQAALSDISGRDIEVHEGNFALAIRKVRNWITSLGGFPTIGAAKIVSEYEDFQEWYLEKQIAAGFSEEDILDFPTAELMAAMLDWIEAGMPRE